MPTQMPNCRGRSFARPRSRALVGLGVAFAALIEFVIPALLSGSSPLLVALVAGSGVMTVVLYIGHGFSARTTVAVLGTLSGLVMVGAIGALAVGGARLTALSPDELTAVQSTTGPCQRDRAAPGRPRDRLPRGSQ